MSGAWTPAHDALVLAGGEARRLGGVSKAEVLVAGRPLLAWALDATAAARHTVVVGPSVLARLVGPSVRVVREDPPFGGPVAGLAAGLMTLDAVSTEDRPAVPVLVLACDVPGAARVVRPLLAALAAAPDADGAWLVDGSGRPQPLVAVHRREPLRAALRRVAAHGGVHGAAVRRLTAGLTMVDVADPAGYGADADTWQAVHELDRRLHDTAGDPTTMRRQS
ncbi:molybdenum cofactor guanylyltransferase [Puerhibacterium sp. TATVAM-FAB25]|uniref:molybdenum cofactor guanylyltransferase n=1 Tax=Puerhibacterium sp. TATVAM-FAB25 TaxID=3093699 RepID=UPI00397A41F2